MAAKQKNVLGNVKKKKNYFLKLSFIQINAKVIFLKKM